MRQRFNSFISACLLLLLMLTLIMAPACSEPSDPTDVDPLAQAVKAMEENPRFSIQRGVIGSQGEEVFDTSNNKAEIWFILPDKFYWHEENVYDYYPYNISIGGDVYVSDNGIHWEECWGGSYDYLEQNPYYYLKNAINPVETERETIDGRECRVFQAELDVEGWAKDHIPQPLTYISMNCVASNSEPDRALVESLGYEFIWDYSVISDHAYLEISPGVNYLYAEIKNADGLTDEMKDELTKIIKALGAKSCDLKDADIKVRGGEEYISNIKDRITSMGLKIYIDERTALPCLIKVESRRESSLGVEKQPFAIDIKYDDSISIERPEKVTQERKADALFGKIQFSYRELQKILDAFKVANGMFPDKLDPDSVSEVIKAQSLEWPKNQVTGSPMLQKKDSPGDYYYEVIDNGKQYQLFVYDYDGSQRNYGFLSEELKTPEESTSGSKEYFKQEDFDKLTPTRLLSPLIESERSQAKAIALNDASVMKKLQDTDYTIIDIYPLYSESNRTMARVVIFYFIHPYKIDYGGLSISVDFETGSVTNITQIPESISDYLRNQLYYKRVVSLSPTEEQRQVIDFILADPKVQRLFEGTEYVVTDAQYYNINEKDIWTVAINFFEPHKVAGFDLPEAISLQVDLKNATVILNPMVPITPLGQTGTQSSGTPINISREQQDLALNIALNDPRVKELLAGKEYDIWGVGGWYEDIGLVGAVPEIYLKQPVVIEYDWPTAKYNKDGTFTEGTYHSAEKVTRLYVKVEFAREKVVEIFPIGF